MLPKIFKVVGPRVSDLLNGFACSPNECVQAGAIMMGLSLRSEKLIREVTSNSAMTAFILAQTL